MSKTGIRPIKELLSCLTHTSSVYCSCNEMPLEYCGQVFKIRGGIPISAATSKSSADNAEASLRSVWIVRPTLHPETAFKQMPICMEMQNTEIGLQSRTKASVVRDRRDTGTGTMYVSAGALLQFPGKAKTAVSQQVLLCPS